MFSLEPTLSSSTLRSTGLVHIIGEIIKGGFERLFSVVYFCLNSSLVRCYQTFSVCFSFDLLLHRMIQSAFVDMESMFDLLTEEKEVSGRVTALPDGTVVFF